MHGPINIEVYFPRVSIVAICITISQNQSYYVTCWCFANTETINNINVRKLCITPLN